MKRQLLKRNWICMQDIWTSGLKLCSVYSIEATMLNTNSGEAEIIECFTVCVYKRDQLQQLHGGGYKNDSVNMPLFNSSLRDLNINWNITWFLLLTTLFHCLFHQLVTQMSAVKHYSGIVYMRMFLYSYNIFYTTNNSRLNGKRRQTEVTSSWQ